MSTIRKMAMFFLLPFFFATNMASAEVNFKPGASLRLRHEFWKNPYDQENSAKDNRNYFRVKTSVWGDLALDEDVHFFVKLTNEFKAYTYYYQSSNQKKGVTFEINEVVLDNLYAEMKNIFDLPLNARLGRQDLAGKYGEDFLIYDGTPMDGTRTYYFNAALLGWQINEENNLDFIYINDPRDDDYLPVMNKLDPSQALNQTDEEAYVLYLKNKAVENLALESYYIYKMEDDDGGRRLQSQNCHLHTIGSFVKYAFDSFTLRAQGAFQEGNYGQNQREAYGGYVFLDYAMKEKAMNPNMTIGVIDLSGDDPETNTNEGWDPLFSRSPWFSDLLALNFNGESGNSYWTNTTAFRMGVSVTPTEKTMVAVYYNFARAHENPTGTNFATGDGLNRGHLPQFRVDYSLSKNFTTYFKAEYLFPGDFYADTADESLFMRIECAIKF